MVIATVRDISERRAIAEEQAALQRVATLVAQGAPPEEVFTTVTAEVGQVFGVDFANMSRYHPDGAMTVVGAWSRIGFPRYFPVGTQLPAGGANIHTQVFQTRRPARFDTIVEDLGPALAPALSAGVRVSLGVPIIVESQLWGVIISSSTREEPFPTDTEARLANFTQLVATSIANAEARLELRGFGAEQAALRRVATLVARGALPDELFAAAAAEVGRVLGVDYTALSRYESDSTRTVVGAWARSGHPVVPVGTQEILAGHNVPTLVFETSRPARIDRYGEEAGPAAVAAIAAGVHSAVGVPIRVEGRTWGLMNVYSKHEEPLPVDTEARLAGFTELVATAIANAEAQAALTASRARIAATADVTRRRIERDLHDGAQQRLVSLRLKLRNAEAMVPPDSGELAGKLDEVAVGLGDVFDELHEMARGIHPAALTKGGLRPALRALARRSAIPVRLKVGVDGRLAEQIELAAYYVVSEALTNTAKHAAASGVDIKVETRGAELRIEVRDDGRGGASLAHGSGLVGLKDRVEVLGGQLSLRSQPGTGTTVTIALPLGA
jgi:signal transduction histidine kinase